MTTDEQKLVERILKNRHVRLVVLIAGLLAALSTITTFVLTHRPEDAPSPTPSSSGAIASAIATSASVTSASASATTSAVSAWPVGGCLTAAHSPVSCDAPHVYEVIASKRSCRADDLISYLGGAAEMDILTPGIKLTDFSLAGWSYCLVTPPASLSSGTSRRILDGHRGDVWRRCLDSRFGNREVPCAEPHTAEFVFSGTLKATEHLDCAKRGSSYLGADLSLYTDDLEVETATQETASECLLAVRGANTLTSSLRRIGTNALPLSPG